MNRFRLSYSLPVCTALVVALASFSLGDPTNCHGCDASGGGVETASDANASGSIDLQITVNPANGSCVTNEELGMAAGDCKGVPCTADLSAKYWSTVAVDISLTPGIEHPTYRVSKPAVSTWTDLGGYEARIPCGTFNFAVTGIIGNAALSLLSSETIFVDCSSCPDPQFP